MYSSDGLRGLAGETVPLMAAALMCKKCSVARTHSHAAKCVMSRASWKKNAVLWRSSLALTCALLPVAFTQDGHIDARRQPYIKNTSLGTWRPLHFVVCVRKGVDLSRACHDVLVRYN